MGSVFGGKETDIGTRRISAIIADTEPRSQHRFKLFVGKLESAPCGSLNTTRTVALHELRNGPWQWASSGA
jgi:hypothetical protein